LPLFTKRKLVSLLELLVEQVVHTKECRVQDDDGG
jgi:hypothetical protein